MRVRKFHVKKLSGGDFVYMEVKVANPEDPNSAKRVDFLVDTGAAGCAIPKSLADELGLQEKGVVDVGLADGRSVKASACYVLLEVNRRKIYTWAIVGEGFEPILGIDVMKILKIHVDVPVRSPLMPLRNFKAKSITIKSRLNIPVERHDPNCWENSSADPSGWEKG